jgi:tetratricopeptide (TPR) repeat protein
MVGDYLHSLGRPWVPSRALVGRESEFATLKAALDETVSGRGSLVLIGGEPGIGKTRLAEELSAHAKSLGVRALWANCWEKGGAPAFWPWIQVLRELLREHIGGINQSGSEAELHAAGVADLARLLPELAERFNDRPRELREAPTLPPDQARFRLFDSIARLLVTMSSIQPLLLVLDDLQWADLSSLMLLKFLARELHGARLLVVCAYRDVEVGALHPLAEFFGDLAGLCHHLTLRGLSPEEVAQLIALMTGVAASAELVTSVHEQTGGNSFFVREMATLLLSSQGRLGPVDKRGAGRTAVPDSVRQVLHRRLDQLSTDCGEQLVIGAILGQEFRLDVLQFMTGRPLRTELELLDEAVAARLVEEMPGTPIRYRFAHALVGEVLYGRIRLAQRMLLHLRAGQALEACFRNNLEPYLAELARHYRCAVGADPAVVSGHGVANIEPEEIAAKAVEYTVGAGHHALALLAYEDAAVHFTHALEALDRHSAAGTSRQVSGPGLRCELLLALAEAQMAGADVARARSTFKEAAACARRLGAAPMVARSALGLGLEYTVGVVDELGIRLLEEALDGLGEPDSVLRALVLARLARALVFTSLMNRRTELAEEAVAMARRLGDVPTLAAVLCDWHSAMWGLKDPALRLATATEVIGLAQASAQPALVLQGRALRIADLLELGEMPDLRAEIDLYEAEAKELRQPRFLWQVSLLRANLAHLEGRFDDAERLAEEALDTGRRAGDQGVFISHLAFLLMLRWTSTRGVAELEAPVRQMLASYPNMPVFRACLALILAETGRPAEARDEFECLAVADGFGKLPRDHTRVVMLAMLAIVCHALGDPERAATLYDLLLPTAEHVVRAARVAGGCLGSVCHYLGLLAVTLCRWDDAVEHFEAAIATHARMAAPPFLAHSRYQYALTLRARGFPTDENRSESHLEEALRLASRLGMDLLSTSTPAQARPARSVTLAPVPVSAPGTGDDEALFRKEGEYWTVAWRGRAFRLRHAVGLALLARLLGQPGRELHALDLATPVGPRRARLAERSAAGVGPILDAKAKAAYRRRGQELHEELEEAEAWGDAERAARTRMEMDELTEHLSAAVGLGGRDRTAASAAERARVNITKAIRSAIRRIAECDPALGDHLHRSVRTGMFCAYLPDQVRPITWKL